MYKNTNLSISQLQPGETAYSWLCRAIMLCGMPSERVSLRNLVGLEDIQFTAAFPAFLPAMSKALGTNVTALIEDNTILPLYRVCLPTSQYKRIKKAIAKGQVRLIHNVLPRMARGYQQCGHLRFCPICRDAEVASLGFCYWHVEHQLPGVFCCLRHHHELVDVYIPRRRLFLPDDFIELKPGEVCSEMMMGLSELVRQLWLSLGLCSADAMHHYYKEELRHLGLSSARASDGHSDWGKALSDFYQPMMILPVFRAIFETTETCPFPVCLLDKSHPSHPFRHALAIYHFYTVSQGKHLAGKLLGTLRHVHE